MTDKRDINEVKCQATRTRYGCRAYAPVSLVESSLSSIRKVSMKVRSATQSRAGYPLPLVRSSVSSEAVGS